MSSGRKVIYWHGVVGELALRQKYSKVIEKLLRGDTTSVHYHKLKGYDLWSADEDKKDRLIVSTEEIDGKDYLAVIKGLPDHKHEKLEKAVLKRYLDRNRDNFKAQVSLEAEEQEWEEVDKETIQKRFEKVKSDSHAEVNFSPVDFNKKKCIEYSEEQKDIIASEIWGQTGLPKTILIEGPPGVGKSTVALAIAAGYEDDVLCVTPTEALAYDLRKLYRNLIAGKPVLPHSMEIISIRDYIVKLHPGLNPQTSNWRFVGKEECLDWLETYLKGKTDWANQNNMSDALGYLKQHINEIYQEFYALGVHDEASYQGLGEWRAIFAKGQMRKLVWMAYEDRLKYLEDNKQIDANLFKFKLPAKQDKLLILEEAHDRSLMSIADLRAGFRDCIIIADPKQRTVSCLSMILDLKEMLGASLISFSLTDPRRYTGLTIDVVNMLTAICDTIVGGATQKGEYSHIKKLDRHLLKPGGGEWQKIVSPAKLKLMMAELMKKFRIEDQIAVVIPYESKKLRKEVKEWFDGDLIFTAEQIKGLEYPLVIPYRWLDQDIIYQANKKLRQMSKREGFTIQVSEDKKTNMAKSDERDMRFAAVFHELIIMITRNSNTFVIVQEIKHDVDMIAKYLFDIVHPVIKNKANEEVKKESNEVKEVDEVKHDEVRSLKEAAKQIRVRNFDTARDILKRLGKTDADYEEFARANSAKEAAADVKKPAEVKVTLKNESTSKTKSNPLPVSKNIPKNKLSQLRVAKPKQQAVSSSTTMMSKSLIPSPGYDDENVNIVTEMIEREYGIGFLFQKHEDEGCALIKMIRNKRFIGHMIEAFKLNPLPFKDITIANLFETYIARFDGVASLTTPYSCMVSMPEMFDILSYALSKLNQNDELLFIELLRKVSLVSSESGKSRPPITALVETACNMPRLLLDFQSKHPALLDVITPDEMLSIYTICATAEMSLFEAFSRSKDGCKFLEAYDQVHKGFIRSISPQHMFRMHGGEIGRDRFVTTAFGNILDTQSYKSELLCEWLKGDEWIDYIINMYQARSDNSYIMQFTALVTTPLIECGSNLASPPMLRLLKKYPDLISNLADHNSLIVLCFIAPIYHKYLAGVLWDKKKLTQITEEAFFATDLLAPVSLSRTAYGAQFLYTILMFRPDIRHTLRLNLFAPVYIPDARVGKRWSCIYQFLNETEEGKQVIELFRQDDPHLTPESCDPLLHELGLVLLTDQEFSVVQEVYNDVTHDNLSRLMQRPDAWRLLSARSGNKKYLCLLVDIMVEQPGVLSEVCHSLPDITKVFPVNFLNAVIYHDHGKTARYFDIIFVLTAAFQFLHAFEPYDDYFAQLDFDSFFKVNPSTKKAPFEVSLLDRNLHWFLKKMISVSTPDTLVKIVSKFGEQALSEGAAIYMALKYLPSFVFDLSKKISAKITPVNLLFGNAKTSAKHFYWAAQYIPGHEDLYKMFAPTSKHHLLKAIPANILCLKSPDPFSPEKQVSPLPALIQTKHGISILKSYVNVCGEANLKILAKPANLCNKIQSTNPEFDGKDVLDVLLGCKDADGQSCTQLALKLINFNPELFSSLSLFALSAISGERNLSPEVSKLVKKRIDAMVVDRANDSSRTSPGSKKY